MARNTSGRRERPRKKTKARKEGEPFIAVPPDPGMRRCAVMQIEARHEETLPSVIDAANRAGYYPHVFLNNRCKRLRGDIFAEVPGLKAEISYCNFGSDEGTGEIGAAGQAALLRTQEDDIDFVVMNSFNRETAVNWARTIEKPVLAIVHNLDQFLTDDFSAPAVADPRFQFIALGWHVAAELIARIGKAEMDRVDVIEPCHWSMGDPAPRGGLPRRIAIPGSISTRTRDYPGLIGAVAADPARFADIRFVLGSGGKDRDAVEAEVRARGLEGAFEFLPIRGEQVPHPAYFASLRDAQAILPLMPDDFDQYQRIKITSSVSASAGFAVPILMDRWSRACYRLPMIVTDHGLDATLDRLLSLTEAELDACRTDLIAYRRAALEENGHAFARLAGRARR
ncbi:MAG: hypothetical protein H6895_04245 [Defluviimonas sp.]|uniref:hypothetical protein n=1 Tax=Albidovulum sp. TaxID=1872424 RepID=UPI001E0FA44C|nr:hypothetical protein [Paracoccaceae bacterium]MCC0063284.1 hypothetical protein [Defluviimonas sp.]